MKCWTTSSRGRVNSVAQRRSNYARVAAGPKASDVAKSARYEANIAKLEQQVAAVQAQVVAMRSEYAAHQARTGAILSAEQKAAALQGTTRLPTALLPPLVPVGRMEPGERVHIDPFEPPVPSFLIRVYGREQLARALQPYMVEMLKMTAAKVEAEHPGTKPTNRSQRKALIDYIVKYS